MAEHRHKRDTDARRTPRAALVAAPLAVLATASAVTLGVLSSAPAADDLIAKESTDISRATTSRDTVSRFDSRLERAQFQKAYNRSERRLARLNAVQNADTKLWVTSDLNLWTGAGERADKVGELGAGKRVLVTGRKADDRVEVVVGGTARWVSEGYLTDEKPVAAAAGLSMAPCPNPGVESGLTKNAVYVYRSVCHAFPQITRYGGWDGHGEHASGRAIDIMTSDVELGTAIADFLRKHAAELKLYDILWRQRIFTQERGGEGWRGMPSRGSATANHFDHVHVSTY